MKIEIKQNYQRNSCGYACCYEYRYKRTHYHNAATGDTVYCETDGFEPYCYMWIVGKINNGSWPGVKMTKVKDNIYSYTLDNDYVNIFFNNGGDSKKH